MNTMAYSSLGVPAGGSDLKQRLSKALLDVSGTLASVKSGALVQVWMPEHTHDGTIVLSCQGLPFAVAGVGDLLALFRCVSVRYRFSTDVMKPTLMGAIGRVYSTLEPEMSHNVQKYDKQVYLRVSEAQRCRVHSTLMVPVFGTDQRDHPLAVFELVQGDRDVTFPAVLSQLASSLQSVNLFTTDLEVAASAAGLRKWPMHIDMMPAAEYEGAGAGRLSPTRDEPRRISVLRVQDVAEEKEPAASSSNLVATEEKASPSASHGDEAGSWGAKRSSHGNLARLSAGTPAAQPYVQGNFGVAPLSSSPQFGGQLSSATAVLPTKAAPPPAARISGAGGGTGTGNAFPGVKLEAPASATGNPQEGGNESAGGQRATGAPPMDANNAQQLVSWLTQHTASGNTALGQLRALLEQQQQQQRKVEQAVAAAAESGPQQAAQQQQPQPMDAQASAPSASIAAPRNLSASPPAVALLQQSSFDPGAAAAAAAMAAVMTEKQVKLSRTSSVLRTLASAADADDGDGEDISSGGEDDDSDDERGGGNRNNNRVGGGAGKRLRFEDLQAQFGLGLKEAANNLGICATTLKRACRRHGIKRWPRRQIAKLSKALNQMGYSGAPPPGLVQNAVVSGGPTTSQAPAKPKPVKKPDPAALQQATQLLFQQQLGAAAAAAAAGGGGLFPSMGGAGMMMGGQLQGMPQGMHGMYAVGGQQGQLQQPQGMFPGNQFMGHMMMAQHAGSAPGAPGGALGQGPQMLLGGMGGGLSAAMQMQGMGSMQMQGSAMGAMQAAALGLQMQNAGGMQMQGGGASGIQMHGAAGMLHPVLAAGGFNMHHLQQHHMQQLQAQQQNVMQQQAQQHHQQQQQQQQSSMHQQAQHHQHHQQPVAGALHHLGSADTGGWLAQASGSGVLPASMCPSVAAAAAMDMSAPLAISCEDAQSPFSGLGMSPGMSGAAGELCGLSDIPEDFIHNLNSGGGGPSQLGQLLKGGNHSGMELMDLLGDDIAAR